MNEKIEQLKDLIQVSQLSLQLKINKIIQTLQRTEDSSRAKLLSEQISSGNFENLEEQSIDDLLKVFNDGFVPPPKRPFSKTVDTFRVLENKKDPILEELKALKLRLETMENKNRELEEINNKLLSNLTATKNFELITISDEDINDLYIENLKSGTMSYRKAFMTEGIIPKSYYMINNQGGS